jgi:hypothetical protein
MAKTAQTTFRLPQELYDRLIEAADGKHPIGEEIRRRLEASFHGATVSTDPKTADLVASIKGVAETIAAHCPSWHESPWSFDVFKSAIDTLLDAYRPAGEMAPPELKPNSAVAGIFFDRKSPELSGQILAGVYLHRLAGEREE